MCCDWINDYPKCYPYFPSKPSHGMFSPDFELECVENKEMVK